MKKKQISIKPEVQTPEKSAEVICLYLFTVSSTSALYVLLIYIRSFSSLPKDFFFPFLHPLHLHKVLHSILGQMHTVFKCFLEETRSITLANQRSTYIYFTASNVNSTRCSDNILKNDIIEIHTHYYAAEHNVKRHQDCKCWFL